MNILSKASENLFLCGLRIWDLLINLTEKIISKECAKHCLYSIGNNERTSNVCVERICVGKQTF